jgi:peptidoglycan-N-acetylmuramic acid deacetylase
MIDLLDLHKFFILKHLIESDKELVVRMANEGHTVCNHTARHKDMTKIQDPQEFYAELKALEDIFFENTGRHMPKYYRPPEGKFSLQNLMTANELGYKTIFWSFAYADWDNNHQMSNEAAKKKILSNIHNGAILLLHPTSATNAAILKDIINELKLQGYSFGTLDELTR